MMAGMSLKKLVGFCSRELRETLRPLVDAYRWVRDVDEFTMATVSVFFRDR